MDSLISPETERIRQESYRVVSENEGVSDIIYEWIGYGATIYGNLSRAGGKVTPRNQQQWSTIYNLISLIEEFGIVTKESLIFRRETSHPVREKINGRFIPFSITSRLPEDLPGAFGDRVYNVFIPAGSKIFYISAPDVIEKNLSVRETEDEFLVMGETRLIADDTIQLFEGGET